MSERRPAKTTGRSATLAPPPPTRPAPGTAPLAGVLPPPPAPPAQPAHSGGRGRRRRKRRLLLWLGSVTVVILATLGVAFWMPASWAGRVLPGDSVVDDQAVAFKPGLAKGVSELVEADGIDTFDPAGEIMLLTAGVDQNVSVADWIRASLDDSIELHSRESVYGSRSNTEQRDHNSALMESSKDIATIVALEHLGVHASDFTGVVFDSPVAGGPADGLLTRDDVILSIDGEPVTTVAALRAVLSQREPGTVVTVTVEDHASHEFRDVVITLGAHPDTGGAFLGVSGVTERIERTQLPFDVRIASDGVGGPSAGLAFTLVLLDVLTAGELTGGRQVAVTGSIRLDGSVGNVGGVTQKAVAAARAGADILIVPAESAAQARAAVPDIAVEGVSSLAEALDVLAAAGGTPARKLELPAD